jgi:predicted transcriptional regulator of viral defense system
LFAQEYATFKLKVRIIHTFGLRIDMVKGFLKDLLRSKKTVYSFKELAILWPALDSSAIKSRLSYYVKTNNLYHIRRGLYAKDRLYDRREVATKIYAPSYISFESVLVSAGLIFQKYTEIFVATYQSRNILCDGQVYEFKRLKMAILMNSAGIEIGDNYSIATPERAFLDTLFLYKEYHFDNLSSLKWDRVFELLSVYNDANLVKKVIALKEEYDAR